MGIISTIKGWISMLINGKAKEIFDVNSIVSKEMEQYIDKCSNIYKGKPYWLDDEDNIKTINFAKAVCAETARLTTLGIKVQTDGSNRAEWLQTQIDKMYYNLREWVEHGCGYGTVILKPSDIAGNDVNIDVVIPGQFIVTEAQNGEIKGCVFLYSKEVKKKWYTRLEYHRFDENGLYNISNRCFVGDTKNETDKPIDIEETPWIGLVEDVGIEGIDKPLFGVFRTPNANIIEYGSVMGMPVFADAIEEMKDLDIAYSRNALEVERSKKIILLDSDRMMITGMKPARTPEEMDANRRRLGLPDYVSNVMGDGASTFYQEINPQLNTPVRMEGINALLSQIGYKCGFSNGYFVFNQTTGLATATQIEAEQQRTIQFIKDMRDKLESCLEGLIYALNAFADLYDLAPVGEYETFFDFGDITYNVEEDRARHWMYVQAGKYPLWMYYTKFEGMTEDEAKEIQAEFEAKQNVQLFGGE